MESYVEDLSGKGLFITPIISEYAIFDDPRTPGKVAVIDNHTHIEVSGKLVPSFLGYDWYVVHYNDTTMYAPVSLQGENAIVGPMK